MSESNNPTGRRGYPIPLTHGRTGKNYMAEAEAIVGRGKPLEEFTREEHREATLLAIAACDADGNYPKSFRDRTSDHFCPNGHQHPSGKACKDCARIRDQAASRDRSRARRDRERAA